MLFGSFEHSLDDKYRLVIPSRMREELGSHLFIMKGFDGALAIYKESRFEKLVADIEKLPFNKSNERAYIRAQLSTVFELNIDKMGRVQIPTQLIGKYHIGKEVVVVGVADHIEIWDKEAYNSYSANSDANFEDIAEKIEEHE